MITCPACGTQNPDTGKFCIGCGVDLTATATEEKLMTDSVTTAAEETPSTFSPPEVPPEYISASPPPDPIPAPPPLTPPYTPPQQSYSAVTSASVAAKDRTIALVLEVLPGIFGFPGIGWLYSGNIAVGLGLLLGVLVWNVIGIVIAIPTIGISLCCTVPITWVVVGVSTYFLNEYTKKNAGMFGA